MKYHTIAGTDMKVSKICLGTMNMGQQNSEAEAHEQLDYALAHEVNFIDTAEMYPVPSEPDKSTQGITETYIGNWITKRGKRDDFYLTSKVIGSGVGGRGVITRPGPFGPTAEQMVRAVDDSLMRLQTDYIDLYQIHFPSRPVNCFGQRGIEDIDDAEDVVSIAETVRGLDALVKAGKVRYVGVSNENAWGVHEYLRVAEEENLARIVTIQNQYSLLNRTFEIGLSEFALREGVELLAYSPLSTGVLSGKYLDGALPEGARHTLFERTRARYVTDSVNTAVHAYNELAKLHDLSLSQMALAFVNSRKFVASNIIGATTMEQLKENIGSIDIELSDEVRARIADIYREMPDPHP